MPRGTAGVDGSPRPDRDGTDHEGDREGHRQHDSQIPPRGLPDVDAGSGFDRSQHRTRRYCASDDHQWRIEAADCNYLVLLHQLTEDGQGGETVETLHVRAGAGTYIYARHAVTSARVIDDLQLSVWLQSDRRGLQVLGRIVFPDTIDPATGRRATLLVAGETYESVGRWQRLWLRDVLQKMERQVRVLRARLRVPVDTRHAYLDSIVVNIYGGPGTTDARLGQLEMTGNLPPEEASTSAVTPAGYEGPQVASFSPPQRRAGRLIVEGRPFFPRAIEYQGEPFSLLRELGFNTVCLDQCRPKNSENRRRNWDCGSSLRRQNRTYQSPWKTNGSWVGFAAATCHSRNCPMITWIDCGVAILIADP